MDHFVCIQHARLTDRELFLWLREKLQPLVGKFSCNINNPVDSEGNPQGFAYVYFPDKRCFFALNGKNLDGSSREIVEFKEQNTPFTLEDFSVKMTWWEIDQEELANIRRTRLPPLIQADGRTGKVYLISPANPIYEQGKITNCLFCPDVYNLTRDEIYGILKNSIRPEVKIKIFIRERNGRKSAIVEFPQGTDDAAFCLLMCKKKKIDEHRILRFKFLDEN